MTTKTSRWTARDRAREKELFAQLVTQSSEDPQHDVTRDELVTMNLPLVEHLARRFRDRGENHEDLVQVGTVGLIKAVDRFDPAMGNEFSTFATPTIVGEIKRHFRDRGWAIRVPRRLQERRISLSRASRELEQSSGRSPTVGELAKKLEITEDEVLEGMQSSQAYSTSSLDSSPGDSEEGSSLGATIGFDDSALEGVDNRESLKPLLAKLDDREQRILRLRFFENRTQNEIAEELGISQMHVSRLLARTLVQLREGLLDEY